MYEFVIVLALSTPNANQPQTELTLSCIEAAPVKPLNIVVNLITQTVSGFDVVFDVVANISKFDDTKILFNGQKIIGEDMVSVEGIIDRIIGTISGTTTLTMRGTKGLKQIKWHLICTERRQLME
jgi:hypothetical protein